MPTNETVQITTQPKQPWFQTTSAIQHGTTCLQRPSPRPSLSLSTSTHPFLIAPASAIDGRRPGPGEEVLAVVVHARLETTLRERAWDPDACIADFFDTAAGAGARSVMAVMPASNIIIFLFLSKYSSLFNTQASTFVCNELQFYDKDSLFSRENII